MDNHPRCSHRVILVALLVSRWLPGAGPAEAADWPTYLADYSRSGVTQESLAFPFEESWAHRSAHAPRPAWPDPARRDVTNRHEGLRAVMTFDRAFQTVSAGGRVFFGSSADDKLYALDAETGGILWTFFSGGPVRLAPTIAGGRVYFGSDDGCVYCLRANDGRLIWKHTPAEAPAFLPGNGRMISLWPVRTSVVVEDGAAYFAAGLFPQQKVYLAALHAENGTMKWKREVAISAQGYLLASAQRLYVPTGRTAPAIFARNDGRPLGEVPSAGGAYALLTGDAVVAGPGRGPKQLNLVDARTSETIATFDGLRMVVRGPIAYMQSETSLSAFDRLRYASLAAERKALVAELQQLKRSRQASDADRAAIDAIDRRLDLLSKRSSQLAEEFPRCNLWSTACQLPFAIIAAGDALILGGDGEVAAVDSANGGIVWTAPVSGKAYGLTVADGRLLVSTDQGSIHCFTPSAEKGPRAAESPPTAQSHPDATEESCRDAARIICQESGAGPGYGLVLGCETGGLARELATRTDLRMIGVERDPARVAAARAALDSSGLYGPRVVVHEQTGDGLPYPPGFANLVVCESLLETGQLPASADEVAKVLRPCGGLVVLVARGEQVTAAELKAWGEGRLPDWRVVEREDWLVGVGRRDALPGSGEWTHTYADPANTSCSGDRLVGSPPRLQWFGEPGPRRMVDRHIRNVPPLYKDGRLFIPGDQVVFAVDAYNGIPLWNAEVPNSRRLGVFLDTSNLVVDSRALYVVAGRECRLFDVRAGQPLGSYQAPPAADGQATEWGYLARTADLVLGSIRREGTTYRQITREAELDEEPVWYPNMQLATSDSLFALDHSGGTTRWTYRSGRVIDTTLTVAGNRLFFLENDAATSSTSGRVAMREIVQSGQTFLVALDLGTGEAVFRKPIDVRSFQQPTYLSSSAGVLLLSGCRIAGGEHITASGSAALRQQRGGESIHYCLQAFDAATGNPLWQAEHPTKLEVRGGHGEYNQHPNLLGGTAYVWPYAYDLRTGKRHEDWTFDRHGHGCGLVSASADCLFWRGNNPWMRDLRQGGAAVRLNQVTRPGCFINMIPAGGLIMIPEASSGCVCGYPMQTSMAFGSW